MLKERREPLERHLEPPERPVASKRRFPGASLADALAEETDEQRFKRELVEKAIKGEITQKAAAVAFGVTERQMQRYVMRFRMLGPAGLLRKKSGKPAHNAIPAEIKSKILSVVTNKLPGYRATLVTEHLREFEGVNVSKETTRRLMVDNGIYTPGKPHKNIRASRERRGYRGELLQMDTSKHQWFQGDDNYHYLINTVDDATSRIFCRFVHTDSSETNMAVMKEYIEKYGIPVAVYTDRGSHFHDNLSDKRKGGKAQSDTQWERAMHDLGITHILANSPQAKGRVERVFRTLQDRLVKILAFKGITTIGEANKFLDDTFVDQYNARFAKQPKYPTDVHRPATGFNLDSIFSRQIQRHVNNDHTFRLEGAKYQIDLGPKDSSLAQKKIIVELRLDGRLCVRYGSKFYQHHKITD
jgi:transposase InsO family protein/transposase